MKHFALVADQRMRTFNFYVVLLAASVGVTLTAMGRAGDGTVRYCGLLHILIAVVFWMIEQRSRRLLRIPKEVLMEFESSEDWASPKKLFLRDSEEQRKLWNKIVSYTGSFFLTFAAQAGFGLWLLLFWK